LFLGLQADDDDAAQAVLEGEFAETADGLVFFESGEIVVAEIAEAEQTAEAGDESDEIIVESLFLSDAAEFIGDAGGDDGSGPVRVAVMQEKCTSRKANDAENTIEGLSKHALDFAADEAGSGEIEIGKGEHVAFDTPLLFLVNGHDQEHGDKGSGNRGDGPHGLTNGFGSEMQDVKRKKDGAPCGEGYAEESIHKSFVVLAFAPEEEADVDIEKRGGPKGGNGQKLQRIGGGPEREDDGGDNGGNGPELLAGIELRAKEEADAGKSEQSVIERSEKGVFADPGRETRAKIVKAVEDPGSGPVKKILLALEGVDVGEEHSDEEGSDQETERNDTLNHQRA